MLNGLEEEMPYQSERKESKMKILQAPKNDIYNGPKVFLAGGITDCKDWQSDVISALQKLEPIFTSLQTAQIRNPRSADFDVTDPLASVKQIKWEHKYLNNSNVISYFFCNSSSIQPIVLYELGRYRGTKQIVTVERGYERTDDVIIQSALDGVDVQVYSTYEDAVYNHAVRIAAAVENRDFERRIYNA